MIQQAFLESLANYLTDSEQQHILWREVEKNYTKSSRHYHTLDHLTSMLAELAVHKEKFDNWDTIVFAITYHDVVYDCWKGDNEARSADFAIKRLADVSLPAHLIARCGQLILATKHHLASDPQTDLFTDADLSILGAAPETYQVYSQQIRREYAIYPDVIYFRGRKKVLTHFLEMPRIYKTDAYSDKYELAAQVNLQAELSQLK